MQDPQKAPSGVQGPTRIRGGDRYTFSAIMNLLWRRRFGPRRTYRELTPFLPQRCRLNRITPKMRLGFLGDIMPVGDRKLHLDPAIGEFFRRADYLVGNFEGVVSDGSGWVGRHPLQHSAAVLPPLEALFTPSRFVLTCANNHSGDWGWAKFNRTFELLKSRGFLAIGRRDQPSVLLDGHVNIASCTQWSNSPHVEYIHYLDESEGLLRPEARFNILSPHWGFEIQLYPNPPQISHGRRLLESWDLVVGHHSHTPQPIAGYREGEANRMLAYSLGNFCFRHDAEHYHWGEAMTVDVGPDADGTWRVGTLEWKFTRTLVGDDRVEVTLTDSCPFFEGRP
jgi:hypothetical protein